MWVLWPFKVTSYFTLKPIDKFLQCPKFKKYHLPYLAPSSNHIEIKIRNSIYLAMGTKESNFPISQTIIRDESSTSINSNSGTPKSSYPSFNTPPSIYDYSLGSWKSGFFTNHGEVDADFIFVDVAELSIK